MWSTPTTGVFNAALGLLNQMLPSTPVVIVSESFRLAGIVGAMPVG
jgi:hypothetical protein